MYLSILHPCVSVFVYLGTYARLFSWVAVAGTRPNLLQQFPERLPARLRHLLATSTNSYPTKYTNTQVQKEANTKDNCQVWKIASHWTSYQALTATALKGRPLWQLVCNLAVSHLLWKKLDRSGWKLSEKWLSCWWGSIYNVHTGKLIWTTWRIVVELSHNMVWLAKFWIHDEFDDIGRNYQWKWQSEKLSALMALRYRKTADQFPDCSEMWKSENVRISSSV